MILGYTFEGVNVVVASLALHFKTPPGGRNGIGLDRQLVRPIALHPGKAQGDAARIADWMQSPAPSLSSGRLWGRSRLFPGHSSRKSMYN